MGSSCNAVMIQVGIVWIAYLMVSFQKFMSKAKLSIQAIFRIIKINLMDKMSIEPFSKTKTILTT